jgi:hypothetical protein
VDTGSSKRTFCKDRIQVEQAEIARLTFTRDLGRCREPCHKVLIEIDDDLCVDSWKQPFDFEQSIAP